MIQVNSINNQLKVYIFGNHIFVNLNFRIFIREILFTPNLFLYTPH